MKTWEGFLLLLDIIVNLLTGGFYGETISSRVGKGLLYGKPQYRFLARIIDPLFRSKLCPEQWRSSDHCLDVVNYRVGYTKEEVHMMVMRYRKMDAIKAIRFINTRGLKKYGYRGPVDIYKPMEK